MRYLPVSFAPMTPDADMGSISQGESDDRIDEILEIKRSMGTERLGKWNHNDIRISGERRDIECDRECMGGRQRERDQDRRDTENQQRTQQCSGRKEIEEHLVMQMPYRSWCPHCVRGRAKPGLHTKGDGDKSEDSVPVVAIEYMYMAS